MSRGQDEYWKSIAEAKRDAQKIEDAEFLKLLSESILKTKPNSPQAIQLRWLFTNKEKIIKLKKIINLIEL